MEQRQTIKITGILLACALVAGAALPGLCAKKDKKKKENAAYNDVFARSYQRITNDLRSPNPLTRSLAVQAAGMSRDQRMAAELLPYVNDPKNEVRIDAAKALFELGSLEGVRTLEEIVGTPVKQSGNPSPLAQMTYIAQENQRLKAATYLGEIGGAGSRDFLTNIRKNESGRIHDAISVALAKLGDSTELILFEKALKDKDAFVRLTAMEAIAEIANRKSMPAVLEALKDVDPEVRALACRAAGTIGGFEAVDAVKKMMNDSVETVRGSAVEALGMLDDRTSLPALKKLLEDTNGSIRLISAKALGLMGSTDGLSVIPDGLTSTDSDVRALALDALRMIDHQKTIEYLQQLLTDKDEGIALKAAGILIQKINRMQ